jgi:hypothetical protein
MTLLLLTRVHQGEYKMSKEELYKNLFHKAAMANFELYLIPEIQDFRADCSVDPEEQLIAMHTSLLLSMIYFCNDKPDESLEIDLELIKHLPLDDKYYGNVLLYCTKTSAHLDRTDEVSPYVLAYLKHGKSLFNTTIPLLFWYKEINGLDQRSKKVLAPVIVAAKEQIGMEMKSGLNYTKQIDILNDELVRAGRDLDKLKFGIQKLDEQQQSQLISE